eukprot:403346323
MGKRNEVVPANTDLMVANVQGHHRKNLSTGSPPLKLRRMQTNTKQLKLHKLEILSDNYDQKQLPQKYYQQQIEDLHDEGIVSGIIINQNNLQISGNDYDITQSYIGRSSPATFQNSIECTQLTNMNSQITPIIQKKISQGRKKISEEVILSLNMVSDSDALDDELYDEFQELQEEARKDRFGRYILRGCNRHRVTFMDQVVKGSSVEQVFYIESYKKYNAMQNEEESNSACNCSIF